MTDPIPPLPINVAGIDQPLPDDGHEAIRQAVLAAIQTVWQRHVELMAALDDTNAQLTTTQAGLATAQATVADQAATLNGLTGTVADLQAQVAALQPAPQQP